MENDFKKCVGTLNLLWENNSSVYVLRSLCCFVLRDQQWFSTFSPHSSPIDPKQYYFLSTVNRKKGKRRDSITKNAVLLRSDKFIKQINRNRIFSDVF